jgi:hypothetical protein
MGHSYVMGKNAEIEVRDSTFEPVLDWILAELREPLAQSNTTEAALRLVMVWVDHWKEMPPGCKDIDISSLGGDEAMIVADVARRVLRRAPAGSETEILGRRFLELLYGQQ